MPSETPGEHPDADLLTAFAERSLADRERERVLLHLAACANCREVVSLAMPEPAAVEVAAPVAGSSFRWAMLRWTAVAAMMIVVGAAVSVLVVRKQDTDISVPATETVPPIEAPKSEAADKFEEKQTSPSMTENKKTFELKQRTQSHAATAQLKADAPSTLNDRDAQDVASAPVAGAIPSEAAAVGKLKSLDVESAKKEETRREAPARK